MAEIVSCPAPEVIGPPKGRGQSWGPRDVSSRAHMIILVMAADPPHRAVPRVWLLEESFPLFSSTLACGKRGFPHY